MRSLLPVFMLVLLGCSEDNITTSLGDPELEKHAPAAFEKAGIWYRTTTDGKFEFHRKDIPKVESVIGELAQAIIPMGQSASYGPEMEALLIQRLQENGVPFEVREFQGDRWLVWKSEQEAQIRQLEKEAEAELLSKLQ